jgi:hypothetical protein
MSNPLLRPNDPRFRKGELVDPQGKNRFGDEAQPSAAPQEQDAIYAVSAGDEARPYAPQYEVQQAQRSTLLLLMAALGWVGAIIGAVSSTGIITSGWICPLIGAAPAAAAWLLAYEDLKALSLGAIDPTARPQTRLALWLGATALIACLAITGSMIYRRLSFLPDLF